MSDLNVIYSPAGEKFEVSRANFIDLLQNAAGWSQNPPLGKVPEAKVAPSVPETPAAPPAPKTETAVIPPAPTAPVADETPAEDDADETADDADSDEAPKARLTADDFADMPEKTDVFAYIEKTFPGNKIDGRANREKLIAMAIELAKAAE